MTPLDFAKAAGASLMLFILNVMVAIGAVLIYNVAIEPGHSREYYEQAAQWIAPWSGHIIGTALFLIAGYIFARRNPARNALVFALVIVAFYALVDAASVGFSGLKPVTFLLCVLLKFIASLTGALLATRTNPAKS
jgi:hypothetical protein